jgi:glycosyltransferase involved in cell wall biosynthesis
MKHIVFVDDAHTFGGAQIALANGLRALDADGAYKLTVIVSSSNSKLIAKLETLSRLKIVFCPSAKPLNILFFIFALFEWKAILESHELKDVDHWVINLPGIEFGLACAAVLKSKKIEVIGWLHLASRFTVLMPEANMIRRLTNALRDQLAEWLVFGLYKKIFVPSEAERRVVYGRYSPKNKLFGVKVLSNVNMPGRFSSTQNDLVNTAKEDFKNGDTLRIVVLGRIHFLHKGQDKTTAIAVELLQRGLITQFTFVGDGVDRDRLLKLYEKSEIMKSINIVGWKDDVTDYLIDADIVLIPSRVESFSLVALEAMQYNCRIVAAQLPCFKEVLPIQCVIEEDGHASYADKIEAILEYSDVELRSFYEPFLKKFSSKAFSESFDKVVVVELD